jgi:diguanylate cyclase (GGDEF)-like protein/PAS domain S-box-containing protein
MAAVGTGEAVRMNKDTYPAPLVGALAGKAMPLDVLTGILGLIEQGVVIAGRDRRIVYVNAAFSRLCGYDPAEILGKTCKFLQGPATDQETVVRLRDSLDRGIAFKGTILNYRKNDEAFWNELCITPIRDETGDIDYYVGLQRDISVVAKSGIEVLAENGPDHFLLDHMLAGLVVHAPDTTIVYANATAERLLRIAPGHSLGALNTDPRWRFLREDGSPMPIEEYPINQAVATRADIKNLILGIRNTEGGDCNWLMCNAYPELDGAGQPIRVIVSFTDITDLKQAERSLKQSEERLQLVLRGSQDASWDWDLVQNQVYYSPRWWQMLGYEDAALPAPPSLWRTLVHPDDADITLDRFGAILKGNDESYELEFRLRHQDGHFVPILSRGFILRDDAGRPLRISGTNTDLTERKRTEEQIHTLAFYDPLTNLANRRLLTAQLRRALLASERTGLFGAVLFIDLDNFKWLNDTLGHDMGDKLLQEVSLRLKQTVRQSDVIARLGGDEFLVMVENLHGSPRLAAVEAEHLGTKILTALRQSYSLDNSRHFGVQPRYAQNRTLARTRPYNSMSYGKFCSGAFR